MICDYFCIYVKITVSFIYHTVFKNLTPFSHGSYQKRCSLQGIVIGLYQVLNYDWDEGLCFGKQAIPFASSSQALLGQAAGWTGEEVSPATQLRARRVPLCAALGEGSSWWQRLLRWSEHPGAALAHHCFQHPSLPCSWDLQGDPWQIFLLQLRKAWQPVPTSSESPGASALLQAR